jgi:pSer/pThr/pTyr-binding forkhead associated (FHA) protein
MGFRLRYLQQEISLTQGEFSVGRNSSCQLTLSDPLVSRRHALFLLEHATLTVEDLGSRNGVLVNGRLANGRTELQQGDRVLVGAHELVVLVDDSESTRAAGRTVTVPKLKAVNPVALPPSFRAAQLAAAPGTESPATSHRKTEPNPNGGFGPMRSAAASAPTLLGGSRASEPRASNLPAQAPKPGSNAPPRPLRSSPDLEEVGPESELGTVELQFDALERSMLRRADSFRVLGVLADKSIALGRGAEAERLLASALMDVLEASRNGRDLPTGLIDEAAKYAAKLGAVTGKSGWVEYTIEIYRSQRRPPPTPVTTEFAAALRRVTAFDLQRLRTFLAELRADEGRFGPAEEFLIQRLESVLRAQGGTRS